MSEPSYCYTYNWKEPPELFQEKCRVIRRPTEKLVAIQFRNGRVLVVNRKAIRRIMK